MVSQAVSKTNAAGVVIAVQMSGLIPPALVFPRCVPEPKANQTNCSDPGVAALRADISREVSHVLYTEAALTVAVFAAMLLYFPAAPPTPPSPTATSQRYKLREGLRNIITSYKRLIIGNNIYSL